MVQIFKSLVIYTLLIATLFSGSTAFAQEKYCTTYDPENPTPVNIMCPIVRTFNIFIWVVGGVLAIMIGYGAIKLAMSWGTPQGMMGATFTWTWAFVGFLVIVGFFAMFLIFSSALGISPFSTPDEIFQKIGCNWWGFTQGIGITGEAKPTYCP